MFEIVEYLLTNILTIDIKLERPNKSLSQNKYGITLTEIFGQPVQLFLKCKKSEQVKARSRILVIFLDFHTNNIKIKRDQMLN